MTPHHRPSVRILASAVALGVGAGTVLVGTAGPAAAATHRSQAVGRFLDGAAAGQPIQSVVNLHDARASYPGGRSGQNPLDVTLFDQADIPLSGKLQGPGGGVFHVGAANQVATAKRNGYSFGAAGAVANQGGAALGGQGGKPANASITLSGAALPAGPIPLPGGMSAKSLGSLTAEVGAVSASAHTSPGANRSGITQYSIGSLKLVLGSPALGGVLKKLAGALQPPDLPTGLPLHFPKKACALKVQALSTVSIAGGAITIDPTTGSLTIDVASLLRTLGVDINALPANTDLLGYVLKYLASPTGLGKGLQDAVSNSFVTQKQNFETCITTITDNFPAPLNGLVKDAFAAITKGQTQLTNATNGIVDKLDGAAGSNPFQPLTNALEQALQIGVNVQPHGPRGTYSSPLRATPDQATAVVPGQTIVRALEIDLGGGSGVDLALANAAAGPSYAVQAQSPPPAPSTPAPAPAEKHGHQLPTAIPAGQAPTGGGPRLPLELLAVGLGLAAAGGLVYRLRPRRH